MTRPTFPLALAALLLLLLPAVSTADEGDSRERSVLIHDVHDLVEAHPWLSKAIESSYPNVDLTVHERVAFLVKADARTQNAIGRVLAWLRQAQGEKHGDLEAATRFRARLTTHRIDGNVKDADLFDFLDLIARTHSLNIMWPTRLRKRLADKTVSIEVEDEALDTFLDTLTSLADVAWRIDGHQIVRIVPEDHTYYTDIRVRFDDGKVRFEGDIDKAPEQPKPGDEFLREALESLRDEVRLLRAELREIKALLEKRRAR